MLLIHADDDRNVQFHETVDLKRRLQAKGVSVEEVVIPDDIHDFLLLAKLADGHDGDRRVLREAVHGPRGRFKP